MKAAETIRTLSKKKIATCCVLVILLALLVILSINDLYTNRNKLFFYCGLVYLVYSVDYFKSFLFAFNEIIFDGTGLVLKKRIKEIAMPYSDIAFMKEVRNNFIEIHTIDEKRYLVHGEYDSINDRNDEKRTVNIISNAIAERSGEAVRIVYKK